MNQIERFLLQYQNNQRERADRKDEKLQKSLHTLCRRAVILLGVGQEVIPISERSSVPQYESFMFRFPRGPETYISGELDEFPNQPPKLRIVVSYDPTRVERFFLERRELKNRIHVDIHYDQEGKYYASISSSPKELAQGGRIYTWVNLESFRYGSRMIDRLNGHLDSDPSEIGAVKWDPDTRQESVQWFPVITNQLPSSS
ncbi:hypothetical protein HYU92_03810 [Candidatus Curtissbacteria bacterium]|nr:hypothetical protein [Candidatus Curtissbacteria bacterium]